MVFASLKKAYFAVTTILTTVIMIGGFTVIIINGSETSVDWAKELVIVSLALWVPSPVNFIENTLEDARRELLGETSNNDKETDTSSTSDIKHVDTITKKAVDAVMNNIVKNNEIQRDTSNYNKWDLENQLVYTREKSMINMCDVSTQTDVVEHNNLKQFQNETDESINFVVKIV